MKKQIALLINRILSKFTRIIRQIANLYRIETLIVRNHKIYYKSKGEIFMERLVQIVFTAGLISIMSVVIRLIFNF